MNREPLKMSIVPDQPCEEMSVDFAHADGEILLLVIDDYSRYPFVKPVASGAASAEIPKLEQIFAMFGTPNVVKSDTGYPFNGQDFAKCADVLGFNHRKVTSVWPRANGEVERFVNTMKKYVKAAKSEGKNWRKESKRSCGTTAPLLIQRGVVKYISRQYETGICHWSEADVKLLEITSTDHNLIYYLYFSKIICEIYVLCIVPDQIEISCDGRT